MPAPFISVNKIPAMSGYFATMWHWQTEDFGSFWEPYETGFGRYATYEEAVVEARAWAELEDIELKL